MDSLFMRINSKKIAFIFLTSLLFAGVGHAQTKFVKYKKYLIPINVEPDVACQFREIPEGVEVVDQGNARILILTDLGGTDRNAGSFDPDDIQSLVHTLTFADRFDIEGIIPTATRRRDGIDRINEADANQGSIARINDILNAYQSDLPRLQAIGGTFPTRQELDETIAGGAQFPYSLDRTSLPVNDESVTYRNDGVRRIIERARCGLFEDDDQRPLYVLSWGSSIDFAQAIASAPDIKNVVRFVSYSHVNDGLLGSSFFDSTCAPRNDDPFQCQSWNFLRSQYGDSDESDLWWVDYVGNPLPLVFARRVDGELSCRHESGRVSQLRAGGRLGREIVPNGEPPFSSELCRHDRLGTPLYPWLKLGDTITTAFALNPASQRNNPTGNTNFGNYRRPPNDSRQTYWVLELPGSTSSFPGIGSLYNDWVNRANQLD